MRHLARVWLGVVGLLGGVVALGAPAPVAAENPCAPSAPTFAREVRGQAWSGVVLRIERERRPALAGFDTATITFRVDRVYRDRPQSRAGAVNLAPGSVITIIGESCTFHPDLGLQRGARYLFSTPARRRRASWPGRNIGLSAAWMLDRDRATLVTAMYYRDQRDELRPGFAEADTLAEVLAIVAPNAPATHALAVPAPTVAARAGGIPRWLALLAGLAGAALSLLRTCRRA